MSAVRRDTPAARAALARRRQRTPMASSSVDSTGSQSFFVSPPPPPIDTARPSSLPPSTKETYSTKGTTAKETAVIQTMQNSSQDDDVVPSRPMHHASDSLNGQASSSSVPNRQNTSISSIHHISRTTGAWEVPTFHDETTANDMDFMSCPTGSVNQNGSKQPQQGSPAPQHHNHRSPLRTLHDMPPPSSSSPTYTVPPTTTTTTTTTKLAPATARFPLKHAQEFQPPDSLKDLYPQDNVEEEEEEEVVEEPEPIVEIDRLDAKCLRYGALIAMRPRASLSVPLSISVQTIITTTRSKSTTFLACTHGVGLGHPNEVFQLIPVKEPWSDLHHDDDHVVRYGDTLALRSTMAQGRCLGVQRVSTTPTSDDVVGTTFELGFYRVTPRHDDQWTVLRGNRTVWLGRTAATKTARLRHRHGKTQAVQSGDSVLLRNHATGGLLSLSTFNIPTVNKEDPTTSHDEQNSRLVLVTHSYDSQKVRHPPNGNLLNSSLLNRLQHHDRILPSTLELFQLVHASVPPCPYWTSGSDARMYLDGTYLAYPDRNDSDHDVDESLFGPSSKVEGGARASVSIDDVFSESMLLDEVIGSLMGLEGKFIRVSQAKTTDIDEIHYVIAENDEQRIDTGLRHLVERILPLSTAFVQIRAFVASHRPGYEYGSVMQAICEAIDVMLQEYLEFVVQMEGMHQRNLSVKTPFTMNKLFVYIQSPLETMTVLQQVVVAVRETRGGLLLNFLLQLKTKALAGDRVGQKILRTLLDTASIPYMTMLTQWLKSGALHDPFGEFMIESTADVAEVEKQTRGRNSVALYDGDVWNTMFRIRKEHVLEGVLSTDAILHKVLTTGKYWNAVQLCPNSNQSVRQEELHSGEQKVAATLKYDTDIVSMSSYVDEMYRCASDALLRHLLVDFNLMQTLLTMKRYFLLDQGDFLVHFLDAAEGELLEELGDVSRGRIQNWLAMSVQLTDPHGEDASSKVGLLDGMKLRGPLNAHSLRCKFASESLVNHLDTLHAESGGIDTHEPKTPSRHPYGISNKGLTGIESFTLNFPFIPFPTSLVISRQVLANYQLLFRHLFFAKHVERRLVGIWLDHQMMKQLQSVRRAMGPTYCLRQRMLHFMQNFIYYMMFEVIEPNWLEMDTAIQKGNHVANISSEKRNRHNVDDIIALHDEFLRRTLDECLLTNRKLIRTLTKLMTTCLLFSDQMTRFMEATKIAEENQSLANEKRSAIQRNLNDPDNTRLARSKKLICKTMAADKEAKFVRMRQQAARVERELSNESYSRMIDKFDEVFNENLGEFMHQLQSASDDTYHSHRANLCIRLDYNGYVTRQMDTSAF